jgi:hypothetical protein
MSTTKSPRTPARRGVAAASPNPNDIAERAYYLWLDDQVGNADPMANWLKAEAELAARPAGPARPKASPRRPAKKTT